MSSSNGISWRHGPHQLAQKLIMTTWPLYCARLTSLPALEGSVNWGAGPLPSAATAGSAMIKAATSPAIRFCMDPLLLSVVLGRAVVFFVVVGVLRGFL